MKAPTIGQPVTIKDGHAEVTAYACKNRNATLYMLAWYVGRKRVRRGFGDWKKAEEEAWRIVAALADGNAAVAEVTVRDLAYYQACEKKLGIVPLDRAVEYYLQHHNAPQSSITVAAVCKEFVARTENDKNLSTRHIQTIRSHGNHLAQAFSKPIAAVTASDLDKYLANPEWEPRTRHNHQLTLRMLWNYAQRKGYVPRNTLTEAELTEDIRWDKKKKKPIWTPDEMRRLIAAADYKTLPLLAIGAFAGVRTAEIERLKWEYFDWDNKVIRLETEITKTENARLVPIMPNLAELLTPYRGLNGNIFESVDLPKPMVARRAVAKKAKIKWKDNASRHSFCTYYLYQTNDPGKVSMATGHSERELLATYKVISVHGKAVTPAMAEDWFSITRTKKDSKITSVNFS